MAEWESVNIDRLVDGINLDLESIHEQDEQIKKLADVMGWYRRCLRSNGIVGSLASELIQNLHGRVVWHNG